MAQSLDRFIEAQEPVWQAVLRELQQGSKQTHWMWFVFPQLTGLGRSPTAIRFGIAGLDEARRYLAHPVLGGRLREAVRLMLTHSGRPAETILGRIDAMKFRSCLTLFAAADPDDPLFPEALQAFWGGEADPQTLALLGR